MSDGTETAGFHDLMTLARLFADPKALQAGLDQFAAQSAKAREAERGGERAAAALKSRESEIAKRVAELDAREAALEATEKRWQERRNLQDAREKLLSDDGQRRWLLEQIEHARGNDERTRRRVVHLSGIRPHLSQLNDLPDWDQIAAELAPPDAHFGRKTVDDGPGRNDDEPGPSMTPMPAAVTLIREPSRRGA